MNTTENKDADTDKKTSEQFTSWAQASQKRIDERNAARQAHIAQSIAGTTAIYWVVAGVLKLAIVICAVFVTEPSFLKVMSVVDAALFALWIWFTFRIAFGVTRK